MNTAAQSTETFSCPMCYAAKVLKAAKEAMDQRKATLTAPGEDPFLRGWYQSSIEAISTGSFCFTPRLCGAHSGQ